MTYRYKYQIIQALDGKIGHDLRRLVESYIGPNPRQVQLFHTLACRMITMVPDWPDDITGSPHYLLTEDEQRDWALLFPARWILPIYRQTEFSLANPQSMQGSWYLVTDIRSSKP
jgi:hypothetical protein